MKVIDPGHRYELSQLDLTGEDPVEIRFVKRIGEKFPGNGPPAYAGTTTQEVIRALIDRTEYVQRQIPHVQNFQVLASLREALRALEIRAAERRNDHDAADAIRDVALPERVPTCRKCGHIYCSEHR